MRFCLCFFSEKSGNIFGSLKKLSLYLHPLNGDAFPDRRKVPKKFFQIFIRKKFADLKIVHIFATRFDQKRGEQDGGLKAFSKTGPRFFAE